MASVSSVRIGANVVALKEGDARESNPLASSRPPTGVASSPGESRPHFGQFFGDEAGRVRSELLAAAVFSCTLTVYRPGGESYRHPVTSTSPGGLNAQVQKVISALEKEGCTVKR